MSSLSPGSSHPGQKLRPGAAEAGEIVQSIGDGTISEADLKGEFRDLVTGAANGRASDDEITLFKSVGTAIEDLAAAELAIRNHNPH